MTPARRPIHHETECASHESELLTRLLAAKNAGLIEGVPANSGLWGRAGRWRFCSVFADNRQPVGPTMGLATIAALLAGLESAREAVA